MKTIFYILFMLALVATTVGMALLYTGDAPVLAWSLFLLGVASASTFGGTLAVWDTREHDAEK